MAHSHPDFVAQRTDTPGTTQNWRVPKIRHGDNYTYHLTGHYKALYMLRATAVMSPHRREGGAGSRCTYSVALCNPPTTQNHPKYSTPSPRCTLPTVPFPSLYPIHFPTLYRAASLPLREGQRALPCTTRSTSHPQHTQISSNSSTIAADSTGTYIIHYSIELLAFSAEYTLFNNCNFNL